MINLNQQREWGQKKDHGLGIIPFIYKKLVQHVRILIGGIKHIVTGIAVWLNNNRCNQPKPTGNILPRPENIQSQPYVVPFPYPIFSDYVYILIKKNVILILVCIVIYFKDCKFSIFSIWVIKIVCMYVIVIVNFIFIFFYSLKLIFYSILFSYRISIWFSITVFYDYENGASTRWI